METKKDRLKKLAAESNAMLIRMNQNVKNIKVVETSHVVLTSAPFPVRKGVKLTK
jgi:hypothetical protein